MSRTGLVIPTIYSFPLADIDLQWTRFLNPQGYTICSGAILRSLVERLMADNQRESAIEQRHRPPLVPKNRRKFLGSHLCAPCAQIMFIERETCSLSGKRPH